MYCAGKRELVYTALNMVARKPQIAGMDFKQSGCGFLADSAPVLKAEKMIAAIFSVEYLNVHKKRKLQRTVIT